jgi:hypothetical protein
MFIEHSIVSTDNLIVICVYKMGSFSLSGGVEVIGFISPTDPLDEYPVIDPLYGIDGFRNVDLLSDLDNIPELRRRAGMVVGVSNGSQYYKLKPSPWNYTISDWVDFNPGGSFTGGTVTGDTIFTQGLTATTFSASTYLGLPLDVYTTGFTFNPSTYDISIERNVGVTLTQNLGILATDVTITGGTYDPLNGSITFVNNTGGTFTVSGFITGFTDILVTGYTYQDNTFTISDSSGNTFSATIDVMTGLTVNGILSATTISGGTLYGDGSNLTGLSTGLNVGTTQITNGTSGRVLFQSGTTLQQDGNFTFNPALKRLTLQSVGSTSSDIPFVIQSSGGTFNIVDVVGTGDINFRTSNVGATGIINMSKDGNGAPTMYLGSTGYKWHNFYTSYIYSPLDGNNGYEGRIDLGRYNGTVRTRFVCAGDSFLQYSNLVLGATTAGARLDVRAQGALSTDIAFRVRNSADTKNIVEVRGDGETRWNGLPAVGNYVAIKNYTSYDATIDLMGGNSVKAQISMDIASNLNINRGLNIWNPGIVGQSTSKINNIVKSGLAAYGAGYGFNWAFTSNASGIFTQSERALWLTSTKSMVLYNGSSITDTHSEKADSFEMYSSDIVAGNAAPHFRTENGSIIKLYTHSAVTTTQEIANALTTLGLLSASTISPSTDYYVTGGTYDFTGDTLTLERNDGNQVQITGFTYERQSDYVYPYFYGGSAPVYTLTSTSTWVIKRVDYTTPGSPVIQQAIGSWDDRYILTYT